VDLIVTDPGVIVAAVALLNQTLERVDTVASRFRSDSEINALHRSAVTGIPVPVSGDLLEAVDVAVRAARLTGGAVDPTVGVAMCRLGFDRDFAAMEPDAGGDLPEPGPVPGWQSIDIDLEHSTVALPVGTLLDLGATAKAWAADRAAGAIASQLGCGVLVSLGGDIAVGGVAPDGGFSVGIADICGDPSAPVAVSIVSGGLATSGTGKRRWTLGGHPVHHLIDPATGLSADSPWRTASVAAGWCVDANTASTATIVMGERAVPWLEQEGLPARLVRLDGSTVTVAGWPPEPSDTTPGTTGCRSRTSVTP
jgi:thiamine biosynthesis lipoprotein